MTELTNPYLQIKETNLVDNSITEFEYCHHSEYLPRDSNNMNKDGQHCVLFILKVLGSGHVNDPVLLKMKTESKAFFKSKKNKAV